MNLKPPLCRLLLFSIAIFSAQNSDGQTLTLINPGTDDRIASISGLDIAGTTYDVTFQHGVSFNALAGTPITFTTLPDANTAYDAIEDFVDGTNTAILITNRTELLAIPYAVSPTRVDLRFGSSSSTSPYSFEDTPNDTDLDLTHVLNNTQAWATFSSTATATAVPEPTTFALAGTLSLGAVIYRRRRKRLQPDSK